MSCWGFPRALFFFYFSCSLSINTYIYIHYLHVIFLKHIKTVYSYSKQLTQQLCAGPQWNSYLKRADIWLYNQNGQVLYFFLCLRHFLRKKSLYSFRFCLKNLDKFLANFEVFRICFKCLTSTLSVWPYCGVWGLLSPKEI